MFRCILLLTAALLMAVHTGRAKAQTVILHTNTALWAAEHANLGVDLAVNDYQTFGLTGIIPLSHNSWFHQMDVLGLQADYRFWFTRRLLQSFFMGPQVGIYHYHWGNDGQPQRNIAMTAGLEGGYGWMLTRRLNLDVCYGAGYLYYHDTSHHHRFTTINFAVNVSYLF